MINLAFDGARRLVNLEFKGDIRAEEAKASTDELERLLPPKNGRLTLLVDFSAVDTMEPEVEDEVKRGMRLMASRDLKHVVRVLPEPAADFTFNLLQRCYYSKDVDVHTVRTPEQAGEELRRLH